MLIIYQQKTILTIAELRQKQRECSYGHDNMRKGQMKLPLSVNMKSNFNMYAE